jgi:hypothetical protein
MVGGPKAGRNAVIYFGTDKVGKLRNVRTRQTVKLIKDYSNDQRGPEVLEASDETYTFTASHMWVDSAHANMIKDQSGGISVVVYPAGMSSGEMTETFGEVILTSRQFTADRDGVSGEDIEGEGKTWTTGVYVPP